MTSEQRTSAGVGIGYGLGWRMADGGFGHQGAVGSGLYVHPPTRRVIALMLQQDGGCDYREWWFALRGELLRARL